MGLSEVSNTPTERHYAHPIGWRNATLFGFAFATVIMSLVYVIWRAVTFSEPFQTRYWPLLVFFWVECFGIALLQEWEEHRKIKRGAIDLPKWLRERNA